MQMHQKGTWYPISGLLFLLTTTQVSWAHPGHGLPAFVHGLMHPVLGPDHLLAALGIGIWAALFGSKYRAPVVFVSGMILGLVTGAKGWMFPAFENGISLSLLFVGACLVAGVRKESGMVLALIAAFGACHGNAHGLETPRGGLSVDGAAGLVLSTVALHATGIALSAWIARSTTEHRTRQFARLMGGGLLGAVFLL
jgi:urease accessory protein